MSCAAFIVSTCPCIHLCGDDVIEKKLIYARDFEILDWCPAGTFLAHGEKASL